MAGDPLSLVLRAIHLDGAFFYPVVAAGPWAVRAPRARELVPRILPGAEHLISFHIVLSGECWAGLEGERPTALGPGDIVLFGRGDAHVVASTESDAYRPVPPDNDAGRHLQTYHIGSGQMTTSLVCGFLGCSARPYNPLLAALPDKLIVRGGAEGWIRNFTDQVIAASQASFPASDALLVRMAEAMFFEAVRRYIAELPEGHTGWLAGLRDDVVGRALACMHGEPARAWTLDSLARSSVTSRSVLAQRFTDVVGIPPMQYLTRWRIHLAAEQLAHGTAKVAAIATQSGYSSEAAFSRAFKRECGVSPAEWRRLRQQAASVRTG